jgi:hypothetical protein
VKARSAELGVPAWPVSAIPGVTFRGLRKPDDYPGMVEANRAARVSAGLASGITLEGLALAIDHFVNFDPDRDLLIAERAGRIVGLWPGLQLVARTLLRLRDIGTTSALLSVDGLNPHGAMALYSSLGFEVASVEIEWSRPFGPASGRVDPAR